jgi:cysteine desulfurase family protein
MSIYLDNAATTYPKPDCVLEAMTDYFRNVGANSGRSAHKPAQKASRMVFETRERITKLIGATDSSRIVFTSNATEGLNLAILGFLKQDDSVITTSMEHNSVMRPLRFLEKEKGVRIDIVKCSLKGVLDPDDMKKKITTHTRLIAVTHASNVVGTIMPIREIGEIARQHNVPLLVDAAQTAGVLPIDVEKDCIDVLAFSGHKGLLGPQGTGCLYVREGISLAPLKFGGTGSKSEHETQPEFLPDRYESGTPNLVGIAGLGAGVKHVAQEGVENIRRNHRKLADYFLLKLEQITGVEIYGTQNSAKQTSVVSISVKGKEASEIGDILDRDHDIAVRCGLHCSPAAHKTIGTFPKGTIRISPGHFTTEDDIDFLIGALRAIAG